MFLPQSVTDMTPYLPEDPLPGQVVEIPDGVDGGSATHITVYDGDLVIGETQQLSKVENVSRKWQLGRTTTVTPLLPEMIVRIRAVKQHYRSLIFVEYFGWSGHQYHKNETVLSDRVYTIEHTAQYYSIAEGPHIYELVCLHYNKEGANHDQP